MVHIGNRWDELLAGEFASDYYQQLRVFLKKEYSTRRIYPHMNDIFNALRESNPEYLVQRPDLAEEADDTTATN